LHAPSPAAPESNPAREEQLLTSEAAGLLDLLHTFVEQSPVMAWISGPDSLLALVNKPWLEFRGRTLEQERGTGWWEGVHPEDRERCHTRYLSAFESRQPFQLECRMQRADGSYAWLALNGVPQYLLNGQFAGYAGSIRTIKRESAEPASAERCGTDQTASVRQLLGEIAAANPVGNAAVTYAAPAEELSSETLLACLETSPTPHVVLGQSGQVVYANAALRAYAAKALAVHGSGSPSHSGSSNAARDPYERVTAWLDSPAVPDVLDVEFVSQPIPHRGEPVSCFAVVDVSSERRGRFLQSAFLHDLLNAASGLEMVGELLEESCLPEEPAEYVRLLRTALKQLLSAIYQQRVFLDDAGIMVGECSARAVLEEVVAAQSGIALQRGYRIEITGNASELVTVVTDKALLLRVLESMLRSAIEAGPRGGVATMGYRRIRGQVEFWVHNPGPPSAGLRASLSQRPLPAKSKSTALGQQAVRLLSELQLKRSVVFSSSTEHGTTLSVRFPDASQLR
jgi:PAS domain S-box-containing protein